MRRPSQTHQRVASRFALLQIDVEKYFVEKCCASEGVPSSMGRCEQHSDRSGATNDHRRERGASQIVQNYLPINLIAQLV